MSIYEQLCSDAIRRHMARERVSADALANVLGIARGTFYAKLAGTRPWRIGELNALARQGIALPPINADLGKVERRGK